MQLTGLAAPFNSETTIAGEFREIIRPGAFTKTLKDRRGQFLLYGHKSDNVLARTLNGTMTLHEASDGLRFKADIIDTQLGVDVLKLVKRGDVNGMSFGFVTRADKWNTAGRGELPLRELLDLEIDEISVVSFPAYRTTSVQTVRQLSAKELNSKLDKIKRRASEVQA